jgi:hypothetical protein
MTLGEVEALLRLLAEWEREELALLMRERHEAERSRWLHCYNSNKLPTGALRRHHHGNGNSNFNNQSD